MAKSYDELRAEGRAEVLRMVRVAECGSRDAGMGCSEADTLAAVADGIERELRKDGLLPPPAVREEGDEHGD